MTEAAPELTPDQQRELDRRDTNYPFTPHGIKERMGVPVPDANEAVGKIIGAHEAKKLVDKTNEIIPQNQAKRAAAEEERKKEQNERIREALG